VAGRLGTDRVVALADDVDALGFGALMTAGADVTLPEPRRDDLASILYTSGTTGLPKGVEHTHESSLAAGIGWADAFRLLGTDVLQSPFPVFGGAGLHFNGLNCLWAGATFVLASADTAASWNLVREWRTSVYVAVPSIYQYWLEHPDVERADLSSLRLLDYGGASMPLPVIGRLRQALPHVRLIQTYGLTEAGPGGTYLPEEYAVDRLGSLGSRGAGPFTSFRVIDEGGADVAAGEPGELVLRGPANMRGYHRDPAGTAAVFVDGWLRSGDVVRFDRDGFLYLLDRKKDLIVRGGYNISSVEIESVLLENPALAEVAAFGLPHSVLGETVAVAVVVRPGQVVDTDGIREHARAHLADFKLPQHVFVVAELPRNASGKVLKRELAAMLRPA
jgi:acyl-CoA synthetase (AMP-forming)/AMP-acid ligase II